MWVSGDGKATIYVRAKFMLHVSGKRQLEAFDELAEAQKAYETGDWSQGIRARNRAAEPEVTPEAPDVRALIDEQLARVRPHLERAKAQRPRARRARG